MRAAAGVVLVAALAVGWPAAVCGGQARQPQSDAVVLVAPAGDARAGLSGPQAIVAVVVPNRVSRAEARGRIQRLAAAGGWQVVSLEVADRTVGVRGPRTVQTEATAILSGPPNARDGALLLQPYAEAFRDLDRYQLLFVTDRDPNFRGLREFRHPALTVTLARDGGPYEYRVENNDRSVALPALPVHQQTTAQAAQAAGRARQRRPFAAALIAAGIVGLGVLAALAWRAGASGRPTGRR